MLLYILLITKQIYSLSIVFFIASSVNATTIEPSEMLNLKIVKIEKVETFEKLVDGKKVFFTTYRGRCLSGATFTFDAGSLEEAQGYVNGFCKQLRSRL